MQMQLILLANIILSIGAIAGISVFASQIGDVFILSDTYGFYWFISTFSLLAGIIGYAYHKVNYVKQQFPQSEYGIYVMGVISLLFTVFWLAASASMTSVLRNCIQIKNVWYPEYLNDGDDDSVSLERYFNDDDYVSSTRYLVSNNYTCNGQIITTTFGYSLFILWCVVSYLVAIKLFSRLQTTQNPESLEIKQTEQVQQVQIPVEQVQEVQISVEQIQSEQIPVEQIPVEQEELIQETKQVQEVQIPVEQIQSEQVPVEQIPVEQEELIQETKQVQAVQIPVEQEELIQETKQVHLEQVQLELIQELDVLQNKVPVELFQPDIIQVA